MGITVNEINGTEIWNVLSKPGISAEAWTGISGCLSNEGQGWSMTHSE